MFDCSNLPVRSVEQLNCDDVRVECAIAVNDSTDENVRVSIGMRHVRLGEVLGVDSQCALK